MTRHDKRLAAIISRDQLQDEVPALVKVMLAYVRRLKQLEERIEELEKKG